MGLHQSHSWLINCTEIEWYPGKCLTQKVLNKTKPKKSSKNTKPITKAEDCDSFFNFFNPPQVPDDDEYLDEDDAEELQNLMEQDYDVGSTIRDNIIPHAVSWYTGEAMQDEDMGIEDDDDEDEDEEVEEKAGKKLSLQATVNFRSLLQLIVYRYSVLRLSSVRMPDLKSAEYRAFAK